MAWNEGNRYGRLGAPVSDAIRKAALAGDSKRLRAAAERLMDSAAYGETWQERMQAFGFIADRLEGKAVARLETASADARELDLAAVVQAVLSARASNATDAVLTDSDSAALADSDSSLASDSSDSEQCTPDPTSP